MVHLELLLKMILKSYMKLILQIFKNIFYQGMPQQPIQLRACQLVSHTQYMNGIEWTKGLDMWPLVVHETLNILIS